MRIVNLSRSVHTKAITCLEVLPTASLKTKRPALLVGAADGTLAIWSLDQMRIKDAFDPAPLIKFSAGSSYAGGRAHEEGIELISLNPSYTLLSSLDEQNNLALWDLTKQGEQLFRLREPRVTDIKAHLTHLRFFNSHFASEQVLIGFPLKKNEASLYLLEAQPLAKPLSTPKRHSVLKKQPKQIFATNQFIDLSALLAKKYQNTFSGPPRIKILSFLQHHLYPDLYLIHAQHLSGSLLTCLEINPTAPFSSITPAPQLGSDIALYHFGALHLPQASITLPLAESVPNGPGEPISLSFHPSGQYIALGNNQHGVYNIYALKSSNSSLIPTSASCIVNASNGYDFQWSPDGRKFAVIAFTDETGPVSSSEEQNFRSPTKGKSSLRASSKPLSLSLLIYSFEQASVRILHQYTDLCALKLINGPILTLILDSSSDSSKREALFLSWNKESLFSTPFSAPIDVVWSHSAFSLCAVVFRSHIKIYQIKQERFIWLTSYSYESSIIFSLLFHDHLLFIGTSAGIFLHSPLITGPALPPFQIARLLREPLQVVQFSQQDSFLLQLPLLPSGKYQILELQDTTLKVLTTSKLIKQIEIIQPEPLLVLALHCTGSIKQGYVEELPSLTPLIPFFLFYDFKGPIEPPELLFALTEEHFSRVLMRDLRNILDSSLHLGAALQLGNLQKIMESRPALRMLLWELQRVKQNKKTEFEELKDLDLLNQLSEAVKRHNARYEDELDSELVLLRNILKEND